MAQRTAVAGGGLASATGTWVGGVVPVDGDGIVIPVGATVTWDINNRILGSKTAALYHGVLIQGASGNPGKLIIPTGITLTLRGFDQNYVTGGACCGLVQQWGQFLPQGGSHIILDVASENQSNFYNFGDTEVQGSAGSYVFFDIPAANKNWGTAFSSDSQSSVGTGLTGYYDLERNIAARPLGNTNVSNAAGTALGSFGDSSAVFSSQTPAGIIATPVASIAAVNSVGKYFVDHEGGYIFYYTTQAIGSTQHFVVNAKRLTRTGASIISVGGSDGQQLLVDYADISGLGGSFNTEVMAIEADGYSWATGTQRGFRVRNSKFHQSAGLKIKTNMIGTVATAIAMDDNDFRGIIANDYGAGICLLTGPTSYVSIQRNRIGLSQHNALQLYFSSPNDHATIKDNVMWTNAALMNQGSGNSLWPDSDVSYNSFIGWGSLADSRQIRGMRGTAGHPCKIHHNLMWRGHRAINMESYSDFTDNVVGNFGHHSIMGPISDAAEGAMYYQNATIKRNIGIKNQQSSFAESGYNNDGFHDQVQIEHNTIYKQGGAGGLSFGDQFDLTGMQAITGMTQLSNLVVLSTYGIQRLPDAPAYASRLHLAAADYNNFFGSTIADIRGAPSIFPRYCTVAGLVNVLGVSLHSPSFAAPVAGKTLTLTQTSATNKTLAWDGGAPQQLYRESGSVTSAEANTNYRIGYLNDSSKVWSTDRSNANYPGGSWIVITSGVGAGQVRRVNSNSATRLVISPEWTTPPSVGDTYSLYRSEVVLPNAGATATIYADIDWRLLPATSQTDGAVAITFNHKNLDPQFVDAERDLESWDTSLGGPGTEDSAFARLFADPTVWRTSLLPYIQHGFAPTNAALATAAHDSTTIGAIDYFAPDVPPNQPTISHDVATATSVNLTGSAFSDPDTGDTHAASQWQITNSADTGYTAPLITTGDDAVHKTSLAVTGLTSSTPYRARVRYKDSAGNYSTWSTDTTFTTASAAVATHLVFYRQPGNTGSGGILNPQPIVRRVLDSDGSLSSDTSPITLSLIPITGGPANLTGTLVGYGPEFAPTDLAMTGTPGSFKLEAD